MELALKLIIFLPLISGILNGIFYKKLSNKSAGRIAIPAIIITLLATIFVFLEAGIKKQILHILIANWLHFEFINNSIEANWAIYVDQLTAIMFLLVNTVSAVVHIYSLGYMSNDKNLPKFLSYLSLFTFFMLCLVSSDNFLQVFFGWEGVGLCSYLLIGYYYEKESANKAAIKAFIVNRVSDFAFIIGIVMIITYTGFVDFENIFAQAEILSSSKLYIYNVEFVILDIICLMLFIGCMGKSAQIGMHVWLPDAMEGPTPVSALIHAATMVTAGVFLLARCSFIFEYSPIILQLITIIGAVTCLFAALIAILQKDIKKIIAYSTCSQLGYMFFACGVSAYQAAMFHLVTHGFFKALLFLSAGSVIHACHEQDIFKMGGLRKKMPITYANFWAGSLAIIGIYPFAGFYSKDLILESAYLHGNIGEFAFILGIIAACLTAIYSLKIIILTFHGDTRLEKKTFDKIKESPSVMNIPLLALIAGTLFSGMLGFYILNISNPYGFFSNSIFNLTISDHEHHVPLIIQSLPLIVGIVGMMIAAFVYMRRSFVISEKFISKLISKPGESGEFLSKTIECIHSIIKNRFFFDEFYHITFVKTVKCLSHIVHKFDVNVIDRFGPNGISSLTKNFACIIRKIQTGYIFNYALYIIFALIFCITFFIVNYLHLQQIWGI